MVELQASTPISHKVEGFESFGIGIDTPVASVNT